MSDTESPDSAAFDAEAEWVECPLETPKSTSEIARLFLIHPDIIDLTNRL